MLDFGKAEAEARGVRKDGSIFYKQVVMIAAYDGQERFIGHHCFMKDITERKQAEQKILEQAALLDVSTEAIFVRDLDNQILFWNKGAERLYGWKAEEVLEQMHLRYYIGKPHLSTRKFKKPCRDRRVARGVA
jgi:PAS domain-containing protein